ncbi:MAG: hypothetical protein EOM72_00485 [Opitutae bacterium]|nr:hypothetical protein [Opitutae bacterium]
MKKLFLVFAKLLGLIQLYTALLGVTQMAIMMSLVSRSDSGSLSGVLPSLAGLTIYLAVALVIAWVLLAKTEWLARKVGVGDEAPVEGLERVPALIVGVALIGIFVTVRSLSPLARALLEFRQIWDSSPQLALRQLAPVALQLALGLLLALKPGFVAAFVGRSPAPPATP